MSLIITPKIRWHLIILFFLFCNSNSSYLFGQCSIRTESISKNDADCGQNNGSASVTISGAALPVSYIWSNNATSPTLTGVSAGVYSVTVTDANNCSLTNTVIINNLNGPGFDVLSIGGARCGLSEGTISFVVNSSLPVGLGWEGATSGTLFNLNNDTLNFAGYPAGQYVFYLSNQSGCRTYLTLEVPTRASLNLTIPNIILPSCGQSNGQIELTINNGTPQFYILNNGIMLDSSASSLDTLSNLSSGNYNLSVVDANGCLGQINYVLNDSAQVPLADSNFVITHTSCPGVSDATVTALNCPGCILDLVNMADTNQVFVLPATNLSAGNFEIRLNNGGCISRLPVVINEPQPWIFNGNVDPVNCIYGNVFITVSGSNPGNYNYIWSNAATTEDLISVAPGTYAVTVTDDNGCTFTSNSLTLDDCSSIDTIVFNVNANNFVTFCLDTTNLPFNFDVVNNLNCSPIDYGQLNLATSNVCMTFQAGNIQGSDTICLSVCDNAGFCDTSIVIVNVGLYYDTAFFVLPAGSPVLDTCSINIQLGGTNITYSSVSCQTAPLAGSFVLNSDGCMNYTPPASLPGSGTRTDTICIQACDNNGVCDLSVYIIQNLEPLCLDLLEDSVFVQLPNCSSVDVCIGSIPRDSVLNGYYQFFIDNTPYIGTSQSCNSGLGTELSFGTAGIYELVVNNLLNCRDTQTVHVACTVAETFSDTITLGESFVFCMDTTQVNPFTNISNFCLDPNSVVDFIVDPLSACVTYVGDSLGTATACFLVCSGGNCDTTFMSITVILPVPVVNNDSLVIKFGDNGGSLDLCVNDIFDNRSNFLILNRPTLVDMTGDSCSTSYSLINGKCGVDSFQYVVFNSGGSDTATVYIIVNCYPFVIYDGFSPNGDGINDFMVIKDLQDFPENEVIVFNRWGNQVFRQKNYQNDWNGTFNEGDLPDGDYYLIINGANGVDLGKSWIKISR